MKKTNYKMPGLPSVKSVRASTAKIFPLSASGVSNAGGFTNGAASPINFGNASRASTRNPQSSNAWSNLLSATTSGGMAGTLSGVAGFSGGISSLISGLTSLLGGGKTAPPALAAYQLPRAQQETISTGSSVSTPGVYGGPPSATPFAAPSGQIVQAVKQALLNSSSLNDVITEL